MKQETILWVDEPGGGSLREFLRDLIDDGNIIDCVIPTCLIYGDVTKALIVSHEEKSR